MCGICGKINSDGRPVGKALIGRMAATLSHRGPDDEGVYVKDNIGLGHRRLSVIDLTPSAHQPMSNEDASLWIVYNGEIYNYGELREYLGKKGHRFRSHSDTEVLLRLYEEEGPECLQKLNGMFAFAIWDEREKSLFMARDRVGKKPLFYYQDGSSFLFASEIKSILEDHSVERKPDLTAIDHYLTWQCVPAPLSAFEGIKKLPPAHYLTLKEGKVEVKRYWTLSYLPKFSASTTVEKKELEAELLERLEEATRIRLVSDVPLGAFLSGGLDSSAVVALMSGLTNTPVKTFSIGFKEDAYNELKYAKMVSNIFGTEHTEFVVEPNAVEVLPKLVWHYNEPFADPSAIPTFYVSKLAREHVTVVLNGDGGDESLAGYERYVANEMLRQLHRFVPKAAAKALLAIMMPLPNGSNPKNLIWRIKRFLQGYMKSPEMANADWLSHFKPELKTWLYREDFLRSVSPTDSFDIYLQKIREAKADNFLDRSLYTDVNMLLPDDLLVKVDVATMANSLEARSPFLDHGFMEFSARLPAEMKLKGRTTKHILKESFRGKLPDDILFRNKMGFGVPLDSWFRGDLKEMAYDTLLGQRCIERGYFNIAGVQRILDEHVSGKWNWQHHIYNLLMLELWHREFIDGNPGA